MRSALAVLAALVTAAFVAGCNIEPNPTPAAEEQITHIEPFSPDAAGHAGVQDTAAVYDDFGMPPMEEVGEPADTGPQGCTPDCSNGAITDGCGGICEGGGTAIGLVPGGAQDAAYFRKLVLEGEVPPASVLPIEGWLSEHGTELPPPLYDRLVTLHAFVALFYDPDVGAPVAAMQLGTNSGLSPDAVTEGRFNLAVVVDVSGSMAGDDKLGYVKTGLLKMLEVLDGEDLLTIVTYSNHAELLVPPTAVTPENKALITDHVLALQPDGGTNIHDGLQMGYEQTMLNISNDEMTPRVMLLSDGVVTQGIQSSQAILNMSQSFNDAGVGVTTVGVGSDLDFDLMHGLAAQGNGNFYFLDTPDKLEQVFTHELEFLLTPVAHDLRVWFTLPEGFGVEEVYGFELEQKDDGFHLGAPTEGYVVGEEPGPVVQPDPDPGNEEPSVAVQTLFAAKRNGLVMAKLTTPDDEAIPALESLPFSTVHYAYDLADTGETEAFDVEVMLGSLEYGETGGFSFFTGDIVQRSFCILRSGLAMRQAVERFHEDGEIQAGIVALAQARTFCEGINVHLNDAQLVTDMVLIETLMENMCGGACQE